ncbi:MAG: hypothetical protein KC636_28235, partial [Myxococcales bacterium]|nr:hypothetical protein [Myxococcales bacterium]
MMSSPANPGEAPFASSLDHLLAEVERVRALLAIAVTHAQQAPSEEDERPTELDALLLAPLGTPSWAAGPASLPAELLELPERVAETITARRGAAPSRLDALCERCRLTPLDRDLLMIAVAPELDRRIARLYGFLRGLDHEAPATVDVALGLLSATFAARDAAQARLASDAPLVGLGLVEQTDHPAPPQRLEHTLVISRRALAFLRGFDGAPPLTGLLRAVAPGDHSLADAGVADADIATIERLAAEGGRSLLVHGPDAAARRLVAEALARRRGRALLVADALA